MQSKNLHQVCKDFSGDLTEIKAILDSCTDQLNNLNDDGYNPFHLLFVHALKNGASADQVLEAMELLINKGANKHAVDTRGRNMLHLVVEFNYRQIDTKIFEELVNRLINLNPKMLGALDSKGNNLGHLMMKSYYSDIPEVSPELFNKLLPTDSIAKKNKKGLTVNDLAFVFSLQELNLDGIECTKALLFEMAKHGTNVQNFVELFKHVNEDDYSALELIKQMSENKNLDVVLRELAFMYFANNAEHAMEDLWPIAEINDVVVWVMMMSLLNMNKKEALDKLAKSCVLAKSEYTAECYVALIVYYLKQDNYHENQDLLTIINKLVEFDKDIFSQENDDTFDNIDVFQKDCGETILAIIIQALRHLQKGQQIQAEKLFTKAVTCELIGKQETLGLLKNVALNRLEKFHLSASARAFTLNIYLKNEMTQKAVAWLRSLPNRKDPKVIEQLADICVDYQELGIAIRVLGYAPACLLAAGKEQDDKSKFDLYCWAMEMAPKDKVIVNKALSELSRLKVADRQQLFTLASAIAEVIDGGKYDDSALRKFFNAGLLTLFTKAAVQTAEERTSLGNWFSSPPLCTQYARAFLALLDDDLFDARCDCIKNDGMRLSEDAIVLYQGLQTSDSALKEVGLLHEEVQKRAATILSLVNPYAVKRALANK